MQAATHCVRLRTLPSACLQCLGEAGWCVLLARSVTLASQLREHSVLRRLQSQLPDALDCTITLAASLRLTCCT